MKQLVPLLLKRLKMTFDNASDRKTNKQTKIPENINKPVKQETQQHLDRADFSFWKPAVSLLEPWNAEWSHCD